MKIFAFCLTAATMYSSIAQAQVMIDMSRVTCAEYLALPESQSASFSAWMSGWFNQKKGYTWIDVDAYRRNVSNVKSWCAVNPTQTVMAGLQRATTGQ
ncbi:HdeA family protein [Bradyrhizobium sp. 41S5]|uniref:HdeA/HdeB family chaperone n=1 Tax=Bradyrhizobium sp. 41S5 TaxID=1404443 RepID=UPI00156AEC18|nr:HdeA/HdeB family chaperone [Bradyrhizobium sp. 41S5]UFX47018.1 HdeA family protein [Bradyrhizobium sp. 41S5]